MHARGSPFFRGVGLPWWCQTRSFPDVVCRLLLEAGGRIRAVAGRLSFGLCQHSVNIRFDGCDLIYTPLVRKSPSGISDSGEEANPPAQKEQP